MNNKINPDSAMLAQVDGHWQKIAAFILWKLVGEGVVRITAADMEALTANFAPGIPVVLTRGSSDSMEFSLVSEEAARRLAAHDETLKGSA